MIQKKHRAYKMKCIAGEKNSRVILLLCILATMVFSLCACGTATKGNTASDTASGEELSIHFLDVGQADSTLLLCGGEAMLIDAGNRDDAEFIIGYLDEMGIDRLKYIVFTHPHEDHIGAGEAVISAVEVDKIFMGDEYDEGMEGYLKRAIDRQGISIEKPQPGDIETLGESQLEFIGPYQEFDDVNDDSLCLRISHGKNSAIFTGDAGRDAERDIIESGMDIDADILKAGHHGSNLSSSYYFLRQVNPRYIVVSCGSGNMYGHPHEEAMSRFSDLGAEVFRTDEQGTVIVTDDGENIKFNCQGQKASKPYSEKHEEAAYIGNVNSKKYHLPSCSGLPYEKNRVYFKTEEAAEEAGYEPCGRCCR